MPAAPRPDLRVLQIWSPIIAVIVVLVAPIGLALAPVPVALSVARGNPGLAALTAVGMAGAAGIGFWAPEGVLIGLIASSFGIPLGAWAATGVPYARMLARSVALVSVLVVGLMALTTEQVEASLQMMLEDIERRLEEAGSATDPAAVDQFLEGLRRTVEQWPYLMPGVVIASVLAGAALALALLQRLLLRSGGPPIPGNFRDTRPPDWLVWFAIAAAGAWYLDRERPNEIVRLLGWNGGIALAGIYWLNGMAILAAVAARFRLPQMMAPLVLILMLLPQMSLILAVVGFFDTWIEFRKRLAGLPPASTPNDNE